MIKETGIDLVEVSRIQRTIKSKGKKFLSKVFTPYEIKYCRKYKRFPYPHFAVRFAAKEAFLKAIKSGWGTKKSPAWKEIEVRNLPNKAPKINLYGKALKIYHGMKVKQIHISLTHTDSYALAIIILEG